MWRAQSLVTPSDTRKKELDGLTELESIAKLERILHADLGVKGTLTPGKCARAKERLENKREMECLDPHNIVTGKRRQRLMEMHTLAPSKSLLKGRESDTEFIYENEWEEDTMAALKAIGDSDAE
jgi:hypothetical protein